MFEITNEEINSRTCREAMAHQEAGGFVAFEGWVRNHNDGRSVDALEYEIYHTLAISEGKKIIAEAMEKYEIKLAYGVHREGFLKIGDIAVWVGVSSAHRDAAFEACRYIIDELKFRLPVWKKEHYTSGKTEWVNCQGCSRPHSHQH